MLCNALLTVNTVYSCHGIFLYKGLFYIPPDMHCTCMPLLLLTIAAQVILINFVCLS